MKEKNALRTVTIELPDTIPSILRRPPDEIVRVLRLAAALHWFERGVLPQEKAAEIAGLDRQSFLQALEAREAEQL